MHHLLVYQSQSPLSSHLWCRLILLPKLDTLPLFFFIIGPILYAISMVLMAQLTKEEGILYPCLVCVVTGFALGLTSQLR
ncbi:hypothetical protein BCR33DRAFT_183167 [Rhizoclosmatium globosum]|uniref:Uncharacterized protein n=1 Tax=Rhizoclosmatium globosum TaxID=329046 RepID=A0A1Y2D132_9FUNG|nr:hypothetical protein BCR33DRAFT_183167 [Rhizoclosmatium globosum]|eukprot:ORY52981.1 hypothetical protein BCR33DRAFT_183167 [Rhizoclosmatium globosum]